MYIRKHHQMILDLCDMKQELPKSFQRFVKLKERCHNLVIKGQNNHLWCTCCNKEFVAQTRVNCEVKCPSCKQYLLVKSTNLQHYTFKDIIQLLDKVNNTLVLRTFELRSCYNKNKVTHYLNEFMRTIIEGDKSIDYLNNRVNNFLGFISIRYDVKFTHWHRTTSPYRCLGINAMVCPYNIKTVLKRTPLEYSGLEKLISRLDYIYFLNYYRLASNPSFEILIKMGLYNLSLDADKFYKGSSFYSVFQVPKHFYQFMKDQNINYKQLEVLRLIQKEDITLINNLSKIHELDKLVEFVDLEEAYNKVLSKNENSEFEYLDYLRMAKVLEYPMDNKRILYPKNLKKAHDKVNKLYKIVKDEKIDKQIRARAKELKCKNYKNSKYIIYAVPTMDSLLDESKQQNNCVKDYCEDYGLGYKDLFFMRERNNIEHSLITIEVRENKIVQARIYDNQHPNQQQWDFLNRWQSRVLDKYNVIS